LDPAVHLLNVFPHFKNTTVPIVEKPAASAISVNTGGLKPDLTAQSLKKNIIPNPKVFFTTVEATMI
jgi:hypothetical protein